MEGWTCIFTSNLLHEADFVKTLLEENHFTVIVINQKDSAYLFGDIEVYVPSAEAFEATQLINADKSE